VNGFIDTYIHDSEPHLIIASSLSPHFIITVAHAEPMLTVYAGICSRHPEMGCVTLLINNQLPQQRSPLHDRYPVTGPHTTLLIYQHASI
jgi:hypothetical protein